MLTVTLFLYIQAFAFRERVILYNAGQCLSRVFSKYFVIFPAARFGRKMPGGVFYLRHRRRFFLSAVPQHDQQVLTSALSFSASRFISSRQNAQGQRRRFRITLLKPQKSGAGESLAAGESVHRLDSLVLFFFIRAEVGQYRYGFVKCHFLAEKSHVFSSSYLLHFIAAYSTLCRKTDFSHTGEKPDSCVHSDGRHCQFYAKHRKKMPVPGRSGAGAFAYSCHYIHQGGDKLLVRVFVFQEHTQRQEEKPFGVVL